MENFQVVTRVRPLTNKEKEQVSNYQRSRFNMKRPTTHTKSFKLNPNAYSFYSKFYNCNINQILNIDHQTIYVADPQYKNTQKKMKQYKFSSVFPPQQSNLKIFEQHLSNHVSDVMKGYNCTIFAYGITGSGKTHTIFGNSKSEEDYGIGYLACKQLLGMKKEIEDQGGKVNFNFSFIEIYNENLKDLLSNENKYLHLFEDMNGSTSILQLTEIQLNNYQDACQLLLTASSRRILASTQANQCSSRSHAIIQINIQIQKSEGQQKFNSKLYIIDLAGSEKIQSITSSKKNNQGANINKSLLALGNCINVLAQNSKKVTHSHIPYRDSKLTRILKDSLGGNTKTIMIACISLNPFTIEETMTTLNYAYRAQGIIKNVYKNQDNVLQDQKYCINCKNIISKIQKKSSHNQLLNSIIQQQGFQELFNQIYQDIVDNIRENQKIKSYETISDPQWNRIKKINQDQAVTLKQTMLALLKKHKISNEIKKQQQKKQFNNQIEKKPLQALSNMHSPSQSRKKSRNKLQTVKKSVSKQKINIQNQIY